MTKTEGDTVTITIEEEDDDIAEALEMAIEALKALDGTDTNVGGMISRQAAIDAIQKYKVEHGYAYFDCASEIENDTKNLPSVQPEIIRCRDCKHGKGDVFDRGWWCELHPSFDVDGDDYCSYAERRTNDER